MLLDSMICRECRTRLTTQEEVPFQADHVDSACPLCDILSKVAMDSRRNHLQWATDSKIAFYGTDPYYPNVRGRGPNGGNEQVLNFYRHWYHSTENKMVLNVHPSKIWLKQLPTQKEDRVPNSNVIPYNYFRGLINDCIRDHSTCNKCYGTSSPVIRVFDCQRRRLVSRGDEPYLTLSYVWGNAPLEKETDVAPSFPPTIEDAMSVTLELGYKYLWIDRYCIDQYNETEVSQQISVMDLVYRESVLTIIAACGTDTQHGLPGVSRPRLANHESESSSLYMREMYKRDHFITESSWYKRGWTFQEVFFARRRLIFTDHEIYYECSECKLWESNSTSYQLQWSTNSLELPQFDYFRDRDVIPALDEYSSRQLTYESDCLLAISGVLSAFERSCPGFRHCWGLPMFENYFHNPEREDKLSPLSEPWVFPLLLFINLGWKHRRPGFETLPRREGFPSWSWCGWKGRMGYIPFTPGSMWVDEARDCVEQIDTEFSKDFDIKLEKLDGSVLNWDTYSSLEPTSRQSQLSRFLHITALSTPVQIKPAGDAERYIFMDRFGKNVWEFGIRYHNPSKLPSSGLALHIVGGTPERKVPMSLIVGLIDGVYERLGVINHIQDNFYFDTEEMQMSMRTIRLG